MITRSLIVHTMALSLSLCACGGQDGPGDSRVSDADIVSDIQSSNIAAWSGGTRGTNRWVGTASETAVPDIAVYIPAPADATETALAADARATVVEYNRRLAGKVMLAEVPSPPASGGYIRVSYLTSYVPAGSTDYQSYCSNVATGPSLPNVIDPSPADGSRNAAVAWVNLGNGHCDVSQDIVHHEFGHALGLANHFYGFGNPDPISRAFWDVLATLYGNPVRTPATQLVVHRAAN